MLAKQYLEHKGYQFVSSNFTFKKVGELDLVMTDGDILVFVEVRCRTHLSFGYPESSIGPVKQRRIRRTAEAYMLMHGWYGKPCRFDVIAIDLLKGAPSIRHIINCM